MAGTLSKLML